MTGIPKKVFDSCAPVHQGFFLPLSTEGVPCYESKVTIGVPYGFVGGFSVADS